MPASSPQSFTTKLLDESPAPLLAGLAGVMTVKPQVELVYFDHIAEIQIDFKAVPFLFFSTWIFHVNNRISSFLSK